MEQLPAQRQRFGAFAVDEKAEAADTHESFRQDMLQEAPQELIGAERHHAPLAAVGVIFPAEAHLVVREVDDAVIGDGDAMGVAAQILEHIHWPTERWFRVHHPVLSEQWP